MSSNPRDKQDSADHRPQQSLSQTSGPAKITRDSSPSGDLSDFDPFEGLDWTAELTADAPTGHAPRKTPALDTPQPLPTAIAYASDAQPNNTGTSHGVNEHSSRTAGNESSEIGDEPDPRGANVPPPLSSPAIATRSMKRSSATQATTLLRESSTNALSRSGDNSALDMADKEASVDPGHAELAAPSRQSRPLHDTTAPAFFARRASSASPLSQHSPPSPSMIPAAKTCESDAPSLVSQDAFRRENQRLARVRDFRSMAALHETALESCAWAHSDDVKARMLLDLAKLYKERLTDMQRALLTFERLVRVRPGHAEALRVLTEAYTQRGESLKLHGLYTSAVDAEWSPERRLELTRLAADIALQELRDPLLAARDWQRLIDLGDTDTQVTTELSQVYRQAHLWTQLGEFLSTRASLIAPTSRHPLLREAIEAFVAASDEPERAQASIDALLEEQPQDPVSLGALATLYARQGNWKQLEQIAQRKLPQVPTQAHIDLLNLVAHLLTEAGQHDEAATAYRAILAITPNDREALDAQEKYLRHRQDHEALLQLLIMRADKARAAADKARYYEQAAQVASKQLKATETAIHLYQQSVAAQPNNPQAYEALIELHEQLSHIDGITQSLQALASLTTEPTARAQVLRRLAEHYAYRANDDEAANRCWTEVATIKPKDLQVQHELNAIHQRRGDFETLDKSLTRQLWRTSDPSVALSIARSAGHNLDDNLNDKVRSIAAWLHVLSLENDAPDALVSLGSKLADEAGAQVHGVWEAQLSASVRARDEAQSIRIGLAIANAWQQHNDKLAAVAAFERVRAWAPYDPQVLDALVGLYASPALVEQSLDHQEAALGVLELAAARAPDGATKHKILRRAIDLLLPSQKLKRYFFLHRLWRLDPTASVEPVIEAAAQAEAWRDLAGLYERLCEGAQGSEVYRRFRAHLASLCENHLDNPHRAYVALQSLALAASSEDQRLALHQLAAKTNRWEDLLAILDACIESSSSKQERQALLLQRADICETHIQDGLRALLELQRLVQGQLQGSLDEVESQAVHRMHKLAVQHNLLPQLEAVYGELWDQANDDETRVSIAKARRLIRRDRMQDPVGALQQLLLILRMRPDDEDVTNEVLEISETLNKWSTTLPVLEGLWRSKGDNPAALRRLAQLYRDKCDAPKRAVELMCEALRLDASDERALQTLQQLGQVTGQWERIVIAVRQAAARFGASPQALELAKKLAGLYKDKLNDLASCLDTHRWIVQVWPDQVESLEALIQAHREAGEYDDLRYRLEQWLDVVADKSLHTDKWLEIGHLCQHQLHDPAGAVVAFSHVIELDPENEQASAALQALGDVDLPLGLKRKKLQVELRRASDEQRVVLWRQLAKTEQQMGLLDEAVQSLMELFRCPQGRDHAVEPLTELLTQAERWQQLAELEEELANIHKQQDLQMYLQHLERSLEITHQHLNDPARLERLLYRIVEVHPQAHRPLTRLAQLLRGKGMLDQLAQTLQEQLRTRPEAYTDSERTAMRRELVRLKYHQESDKAQVEQLLLEPSNNAVDSDGQDAMWLAMIARQKDDHSRYIEQRKRHLGALPNSLGAFVLCHLAEYLDKHGNMRSRVLGLYREARSRDPQSTVASEALRGLGRGVATWRATASLLPDTDEFELSDEQRSERLFARAKQCLPSDEGQCVDWLERTVAVNPNHVAAWDLLADIATQKRDYETGYTMARQAVDAYERTVAPSSTAKEVESHALRMAQAASLARLADMSDEARELAEVAYGVDPNVVSAALLVADTQFELNDKKHAAQLYQTIIDRHGEQLEPQRHAQALHRIAKYELEHGHHDVAQASLRKAIALAPLHAPALTTMARVQKELGRPVSSVLDELTALVVSVDGPTRGRICLRIAQLCDKELHQADEAGAWFELAVDAGIRDYATMRRLLHHYRKTGRAQQALVAIGELIENATDPMDLAELWATRGSILVEYDLDEAETALDTALSFNPSNAEALACLCTVLEGRKDYEQLTAMLESRAETGTFEQRVEVLNKLVELWDTTMHDPVRTEQYLRKIIDLDPKKSHILRLFELVESDASRTKDQLEVMVKLMPFAQPLSPWIINAAKLIYDQGHKHWCWNVLSFLLGASPVDPWTRSTLSSLRKDYERFDAVTCLSPQVVQRAGNLLPSDEFVTLLSELCERVFVKTDTQGCPTVDVRTGPGRLFARVCQAMGMEGELLRSMESEDPITLYRGAVPTIALRSDLLSAPVNELAYVFAFALMQARPSCLALASVPASAQAALVAGIDAAVRDAADNVQDPAVQHVAALVGSVLTPEDAVLWKELLQDSGSAQRKARQAMLDLELAAVRVACVAAGDSRTATRSLSRLVADAKRPPGVGGLEVFDAFLGSLPMAGHLFGWLVSETFGEIIASSGG